MKKLWLFTAVLIVALLPTLATASSSEIGPRRLVGPFCIGKHHLMPVFVDGVRIMRAGVVRSVARTQACNDTEIRKLGVEIEGKVVVGPAGPQGERGSDGAQGAKGDKGEAGLPGVAGAKGETGATGAKGEVGPAGAQGVQGEVGPAGPAGAQGVAGPAGPKGDTGDAGPAGPAGAPGAPGAVGPAGPAGATGPAGAVGPAGPQGPAGPAGPQGPAGLDGSAILTVAGGTASGDKQFTVSCPTGKFAISGGFNIQGSVTASFRSNAAGNPTGNNAWTIIQSSGAALSGTVYVYCV